MILKNNKRNNLSNELKNKISFDSKNDYYKSQMIDNDKKTEKCTYIEALNKMQRNFDRIYSNSYENDTQSTNNRFITDIENNTQNNENNIKNNENNMQNFEKTTVNAFNNQTSNEKYGQNIDTNNQNTDFNDLSNILPLISELSKNNSKSNNVLNNDFINLLLKMRSNQKLTPKEMLSTIMKLNNNNLEKKESVQIENSQNKKINQYIKTNDYQIK